MKRITVLSSILILGFITINCSSVYIAETNPKDALYKYNKESIYVEDKAAAIQKRYINPIPLFLRCGMNPAYIRWKEFVKKQHDDLTVDALLHLYHTNSDENVQSSALHALSTQRKKRLIILWEEVLRNHENINEADAWSAVYGLSAIDVPQSNQILLSLRFNKETPSEILAPIYQLIREKGMPQVSTE